METLTRTSVAKRESFLKGIRKVDSGKNARRALNLLLEIQERYEHDDISWELATANESKGNTEVTWEMVTQNGKYSLD